MPCRSLLPELQLRQGTVCRACLSNLSRRTQPAPARQWTTPQYTTGSAAALRRRGRAPKRTTKPAPEPEPAVEESNESAMSKTLQRWKAAAMGQTLEKPVIRYYEEGDDKKVHRLRTEDEFDRSLTRIDTGELKSALTGLGATAGSASEKSAFDEILRTMGPALDNIQGPEDMEKLSAMMKAYSASIDRKLAAAVGDLPEDVAKELKDVGLDEEIESIDKLDGIEEVEDFEAALRTSKSKLPAIPEMSWSMNQRRKISRLNTAIKQAASDLKMGGDITNAHVQSIYKAYHSSRLTLARSWSTVPIDVWDFLWKVFSAEEDVNIHRLSHVALLSRDMSEANVDLTPKQQLLTIEAVFVDGWEAKALESWKRCQSTLGEPKSETFEGFWQLGVRMYCRLGDLDQAQRAADKLVDRRGDPRILMPLIRTYSEKGTEEYTEKAWATYRQMRELLGKTMKLSDYDQVVSYFLTTNQVENALQAFVDMMSDGQIDLKKHHFMPSVVANKFFLGKWLKRLIGAGDLDGAHSVVKFMREKGVGASPVQLNGLIGAWLRSGGAEDLEKADQLAWEMIEARLDFVKTRASKSIKDQSQDAWRTTKPRATLETFSLLADNYRLRAMHKQLGDLWSAFRDAKISADAFMMNQLLESQINSGKVSEALKLYDQLVHGQGVTPDPYSFSALWKTLNVNNFHIVRDGSKDDIVAARKLFAETVRFRNVFDANGGMDGQLARKILHTFRRLKDIPGTLVALSVLKEIFNFMPPDTLVLEMAIGTTKLSWEAPASRRRLMSAKREMDHALLEWADGDASLLEGEQRREGLHDYLRTKLRAAVEDGKDYDELLGEAATQMGVADLLGNDV